MKTYLFEASNGSNWGKFLVGVPDEEWTWTSRAENEDGRPILHTQGWTRQHILVVDLATGEGALFYPGGYAPSDLNRNRIRVCILFEGFLEWLYRQNLADVESLPRVVALPHVEPALFGWRRPGTSTGLQGTTP